MKSDMQRKRGAATLVLAFALAVTAAAVARAEEQETGNQVSFRGGWADLAHSREDQVFTDVNGNSGLTNNGKGGYYVGGALDLALTRDSWGLMDKLMEQGEIGVEYKRFNSQTVVSATGALLGSAYKTAVPISMLTVDIAPKLRYTGLGRFEPWIIPVGLDFIVVSPPSNQVGYLDVGLEFGAGADYRVWKELKVGLDARYHVASDNTGTSNNFTTVGSYLAIGF
jgi:opacity protein-like surface antigen